MKATVLARSAQGNYSAKTDSNILIVFKVVGSESLAVGEAIEVDLPNVLASQQIVRRRDNRTLRIELAPSDIHDLDLPAGHGAARMPSPERMRGG